ncbi:hypothetical protein DFH09DRAFT_1083406 [Mycena vulgaris]|nr:hypothetical protein DFH09DRAFT_1083406 [Mycena vulgaris]
MSPMLVKFPVKTKTYPYKGRPGDVTADCYLYFELITAVGTFIGFSRRYDKKGESAKISRYHGARWKREEEGGRAGCIWSAIRFWTENPNAACPNRFRTSTRDGRFATVLGKRLKRLHLKDYCEHARKSISWMYTALGCSCLNIPSVDTRSAKTRRWPELILWRSVRRKQALRKNSDFRRSYSGRTRAAENPYRAGEWVGSVKVARIGPGWKLMPAFDPLWKDSADSDMAAATISFILDSTVLNAWLFKRNALYDHASEDESERALLTFMKPFVPPALFMHMRGYANRGSSN